MKKLLVVLLAFACVFAVSAQVTTSVATSGAVNFAKAVANNATNPQAGIAMDGEWNDALTFTAADKDGKFGGKLYFGQFNATVVSAFDATKYGTAYAKAYTDAIAAGKSAKDAEAAAITAGNTAGDTLTQVAKLTNWSVWYQYDFGKVELGTAGSGFNGDLNTDIVDKWDVDGQGTGIYYSTPALSGFTAQVFFAAPTTAQDAYDSLRTSGASVQYVMENTFKVKAQATAGLVKNDSKANCYFDFTGVPNLDVYANAQWDQTNADSLAAFGASYTAGALKVIGEFESNWGAAPAGDFLWDAAIRANYTLNSSLAFRLQGAYLANTGALASTAQIVGKGYVYYTVGNGLKANLMLGYDTVNNFIYQLYAGYAISL